MKKIILFIILLCFSFFEAFGALETPSTQGTQFFFGFMPASSKDKLLILTVSSPKAGVAKFTSSTGVVTTQPISQGITEITLAQLKGSDNSVMSGSYGNCYTTVPNAVQQEGYMVQTFLADGTTPLKVSLYAGLSHQSSSDCANVYPIEALGNEYYVMSRSGNAVGYRFVGTANQQYNNGTYPSEMLIVGADTTSAGGGIDIYPTCLIVGQSETDDVYSKIHITLKKGETYLIQALSSDITKKGETDLVGTRIVSTDDGNLTGNKCKKFAVYSGSMHGSGVNSPYNNGDYEYDQLFPVNLWGTDYIVGSTTKGQVDDACSKRAGRDEIRVVASQPCTDVYINNKLEATLNPGDFYSHRDTLDLGTFVHATKPVEVGLFTTGEDLLCSDGGADGGPALIVLAPLQQYLRDITFAVYKAAYDLKGSTNVTQHSLMITSLTSIEEQTTLNGVALTNGSTLPLTGQTISWSPIASNPKYSQLIIVPLDKTISYTLKNAAPKDSLGGFTAIVYGSQGKNAGYGYSVGASAATDSITFNLNGSAALNSSIKTKKCVDKDVTFTPDFPSGLSIATVEWDFDGDGVPDTVTTSTNSYIAEHIYAKSGTYTVSMIVHKSVTGCFSASTSDTASTQVTIRTTVTPSGSAPIISICKDTIYKAALPTALSAVDRSKINFRWMTTSASGGDSIIDAKYQPSMDTIKLSLDYGQYRKFWRRSWSSDDNCTQYADTFKIQVLPKTVYPTIPELDRCYGTTISSQHQSATNTYTWYKSDATGTVLTLIKDSVRATLTLNSAMGLTYGSAGIFRVEAKANTGCVSVDVFDVSIKKKQEFSANSLGTVCLGATVLTSLHQNSTQAPDLVGTPTYTWYNASGAIVKDSVRASLSIDAALGLALGTSTEYSVESNTGCAYIDKYTFTIPAKITNSLAASSYKVCGDGRTLVTVNATQAGPANSNSWDFSTNGGAFVSLTQPAGALTYNYYPTEQESFRFTSVGQCETVTSNDVTVSVNPPFTATLDASSADFIAPNMLPISGGTVTLDVSESLPGSYKYKWYSTDEVAAKNVTNKYSASISSDYTYFVVVADADDLCKTVTDTINITLGSIVLHTILIPSSFNDLNKTFARYNEDGDQLSKTFKYGYTITIFNRYGQKIFDKTNDGWDGSYNGKAADAGVYFYVLEYSTSDNKTKTIKGTIEVVK
ncbi:MAG: gliding motility-associated C-terminal domain-containing protein [Paludibacteraceae bacterium]|nr:gliding motility-associated C-terminal domain-containing protein [Paludibacteraceae bacterium]